MRVPQEDVFDVRHYLDLVRKRALLLGTILLVCVTVAVIFSFAQPKVYSASSRVVLSNQQDAITQAGALTDPNAFQNQLGTQVQVAESPDVQAAADEVLGADANKVIDVSAKGVSNTRIMEITATSKSPVVARNAANAYAQAYLRNREDSEVNALLSVGVAVSRKQNDLQTQIDALKNAKPATTAAENEAQIASLQTQIDQLQKQYDSVQTSATVRQSGASVLSSAEVPDDPTAPDPIRIIGLAVVLGTLVGISSIILLDRLDDGVRNEAEVARHLPDIPLLAGIPHVNAWSNQNEAQAMTSTHLQPAAAAEAYRRLRTSMEFTGLNKDLRVVQVTSASAAEGKSTTVANLATALAWAGKHVIVVSADMRRPSVHEFFGLTGDKGLTSVLIDDDDLDAVLQDAPVDGDGSVRVLATGSLPPNPTELLSSDRMRELTNALRERADYVLIDTPPLLPVADPLVLASYVDGVVLVVSAKRSRAREQSRARALLKGASVAAVVGVVLNDVDINSVYSRKDAYYHAAVPS